MNSKMRIINAQDYLFRERCSDLRARYKKICSEMMKRNVMETPFVDCEPVGKPVHAEVNFGQWIAQCECGGAESVHWDEPIFYCCSCGNYANHGKPRAVIFPSKKEIKDIETVLLKRPVIVKGGTHMIERTVNARPAIIDEKGVLSRSWIPGETVKDLRKENESIKAKVEKRMKDGT